jgi:hypothetical protein
MAEDRCDSVRCWSLAFEATRGVHSECPLSEDNADIAFGAPDVR